MPSVYPCCASAADGPICATKPFFETNPALRFERARAYGMRLDIPAGTAVRFEPGQVRTVTLIALSGDRIVHGFNALVSGPLLEEAP